MIVSFVRLALLCIYQTRNQDVDTAHKAVPCRFYALPPTQPVVVAVVVYQAETVFVYLLTHFAVLTHQSLLFVQIRGEQMGV